MNDPVICPLINYLKTQIPEIISDQHAERLAEMIIIALPELFTEKPKIFSRALVIAGSLNPNNTIKF
ncbi:hypothetical protein [Nostoc sp.]|uniref:hypothetical protein n=1 Tax=Nostoc sp. TaxID=1180 RepID=UPI002FF710EB